VRTMIPAAVVAMLKPQQLKGACQSYGVAPKGLCHFLAVYSAFGARVRAIARANDCGECRSQQF
jgi:hypothetical protein